MKNENEQLVPSVLAMSKMSEVSQMDDRPVTIRCLSAIPYDLEELLKEIAAEEAAIHSTEV